jgi:hypothetical protein
MDVQVSTSRKQSVKTGIPNHKQNPKPIALPNQQHSITQPNQHGVKLKADREQSVQLEAGCLPQRSTAVEAI